MAEAARPKRAKLTPQQCWCLDSQFILTSLAEQIRHGEISAFEAANVIEFVVRRCSGVDDAYVAASAVASA